VAEIRPFRALRFDASRVELERVLAPVYDVVTPEDRVRFYERDPHNAIRLELTKTVAEEAHTNYGEVAHTLAAWRRDGVLRLDAQPALYALRQRFSAPGGGTLARTGFFCALRLEDYAKRIVRPHERTLAGPKADRLKILRASRTNLSAVFLLYEDPDAKLDALLEQALAASEPQRARDAGGVEHELVAIADPAAIAEVQQFLAPRPLVIADGHHRYETGLAYQAELRAKGSASAARSAPQASEMNPAARAARSEPQASEVNPAASAARSAPQASEMNPAASAARSEPQASEVNPAGADLIFVYLANAYAAGSLLLPIHRLLVRAPAPSDVRWAALERVGWQQRSVAAESPGQVEAALRDELAPHAGAPAFAADDGHGRLRVFWKPATPELSIEVFHREIVVGFFGLDEAAVRDGAVAFPKAAAEAAREVRAGRGTVALYLNPLRPEDVFRVTAAGATLPQKSTFFYPKLPTGLLFRSLDES
jgi:uncharacterized protein (DUF1015 family)